MSAPETSRAQTKVTPEMPPDSAPEKRTTSSSAAMELAFDILGILKGKSLLQPLCNHCNR
jgi:hypothetical protein